MELSTIVMGLIALILFLVAFSKGQGVALEGLKTGGELLLSVAPRLLFAFAISGLIQVLIPKQFIGRWIGRGSGWKGLLIASIAGVFTPGGPILSFPIVASLYQSGAGMGPLVSYLTSWALLGLHRLIAWEFPLMGPRFVAMRVLVSVLMPPLAGWLVMWLAHE
ncbi:MAG: permease [candidate division NC10 bacterium]|nr:permease [candidate division NC10 bacterium]